MTLLHDAFHQNVLITASFVTFVIGWISNRIGIQFFSTLLFRKFYCSIRVTSDDHAFGPLVQWCADIIGEKNNRSVAVFHKRRSNDVNNKHAYTLVPTVGVFFAKWRNHRIIINREEKTSEQHSVTYLTVWFRSKTTETITTLIEEAYQLAKQKEKTYSVNTHDEYGDWASVPDVQGRALETLVYDQNVIKDVLQDMQHYENDQKWYSNRGIPYHRGYLLSGPPGTGKTSLVTALALRFNRPIYLVDLSSLTNIKLNDLIRKTPPHCIILFEDIDASQNSRTQEKSSGTESATGVTLSGLLNALEGVATPEGQIFILTTNYVDQLDPALIRPGRVDRHFVLDCLQPHDQKRMSLKFYPEGSFVPLDHPVSPADLQAAFMRYPTDATKARQVLAQKSTREITTS